MIITASIDTEAREAAPTANFATLSKLPLRGSGSSLLNKVYIYPAKQPFPAGATITNAKLRLFLAGAWPGTNNITVHRVTSKWAETTLTYNNQPNDTATNAASATVVGGVDKQMVEIDVTAIYQDVANGGAFFGFQVTLSQDVLVWLYSTEWNDATLRPQVEIEWSQAPAQPDRLSPDGGLAVSLAKPLLTWQFSDKSGSTVQAYAQVQMDKDVNVLTTGTPAFDSGKIALTESQYDTSSGAFAGAVAGDTWYWRVMVWDGTNLASTWSDPATFAYTQKGTLTINSPGATAPETTPPIEWTLTGATQQRYEVFLYRISPNGTLVPLWNTADTSGSTTAVTPPAGLIKGGYTYRASVSVWDTVDRANDDHLNTHQDFTYVNDGTPNPVTGVTVTRYVNDRGESTPALQINFSRSIAPDYFAITADGVLVADRVDVNDAHLSGDNYQVLYWGATPRQAVTVGVEAVVLDTGVLKHSTTVEAPAITPNSVGIWLVAAGALVEGATPGTNLCVYGNNAAQLTIGEVATTFDLAGSQAPVRITSVVRGYEGTVTGTLLGTEARDAFYTLKGLRTTLLLILGDLNLPIEMEEGYAIPTPVAGDQEYDCSFNCFQVGEPWPIAAVS